jgi:GntR family transcriptional regulator, transcriptional repressor for pyruvate dehydrogenase complex
MQTNSLTSRVTDFIFDYVRDNGLVSGDNLPSELRTSTDLGVSRSIVREAFCSLEIAGIIEKGNGRSPRVGMLNSGFLTHLLRHALSTKQVSTEQILDLRASIEVRAAEMAALRRTVADLAELDACVTGMGKSISSPQDFVQHDLKFHEVINGASGNPLVEVFGGAMHECMQQSMMEGLVHRASMTGFQKVVHSHAEIVSAIEKRNPLSAGKLMKHHFAEAKEALRLPTIAAQDTQNRCLEAL